jgi:hypothetical protein
MPLSLPSRPSLVRLKRLAKELLSAARRGDEPSLLRLRALFASVTADTAKLSEAQTALARDYGFPGWSALAAAVTKRTALLAAKAARIAARTTDAAELAENWFALAEAGDLDRLWHAMGVGKHRSNAARAIMLADQPRYDRFVDVIVLGLAHRNGRARFEYAHILDSFGDARCIAPLRALMDDPVPRVRWMAIHALTCHDCNEATCPDDPELLERITHHLHHDESAKVRFHAAIALGEAGGIGARATLEAVVAEAADPRLKRAAAYGLKTLAERMAE